MFSRGRWYKGMVVGGEGGSGGGFKEGEVGRSGG